MCFKVATICTLFETVIKSLVIFNYCQCTSTKQIRFRVQFLALAKISIPCELRHVKSRFCCMRRTNEKIRLCSAQSDLHICSSLYGKNENYVFDIQFFKFLASLCSLAAWSALYQVIHPENKLSRDPARLQKMPYLAPKSP